MKKLYHYFQKVNRYLRRGKKNPMARQLSESQFKPQIQESKKVYNRKKYTRTILEKLRDDGLI